MHLSFALSIAALMVTALGLAACGHHDDRPIIVIPQAAAPQSSAAVVVPDATAPPARHGSYTTVDIPEGATVLCPSGAAATFTDRAYHC